MGGTRLPRREGTMSPLLPSINRDKKVAENPSKNWVSNIEEAYSWTEKTKKKNHLAKTHFFPTIFHGKFIIILLYSDLVADSRSKPSSFKNRSSTKMYGLCVLPCEERRIVVEDCL
jgi:hypothetical protein